MIIFFTKLVETLGQQRCLFP